MQTRSSIAVIHCQSSDSDNAFKISRVIREAMIRGRDVVLICDAPMLRRAARLSIACLTVQDTPGRFAIVTRKRHSFAESIPRSLRSRLQMFDSTSDACDWLNPCAEDPDETLLCLPA